MIALLQEKKLFAFDTETTGINPLVHPMVGISFATDADHAWYVPFGHQVQQEQLAKSEVVERLRPLLEGPAYKKIAHHASFDVAVLRRAGIYVRGVSFDTMIAARLVNTLGQKAGLKDLSERYLGQPMLNYQEVVTEKGYKHFGQVPLEEATPYAAADARQTLLLYPVLQQALQKEGLLMRAKRFCSIRYCSKRYKKKGCSNCMRPWSSRCLSCCSPWSKREFLLIRSAWQR
jgi:DNA polymerase-1